MIEVANLRERLVGLNKDYRAAHDSYMQAINKQTKAATRARRHQQRLMQAIDTNTESNDMIDGLRQIRADEKVADEIVISLLKKRQDLYFEIEKLHKDIEIMEAANVK